MKIKHVILFSTVVLALSSCKDKNAVFIKGDLNNPHAVKTVYLLKPDTLQEATVAIVDSTSVNDGQFVFKLQAPQPVFYELLLDGNRVDVIAKNGEEIRIKMNLADSTGAYEIAGSEDSEKLMELNKIQHAYFDKIAAIDAAYFKDIVNAKTWADSDAVMTRYDQPYESNGKSHGTALLKFMNENSASISAVFAARQLDSHKYEQQMIAYADSAKHYFPENLQVKKFVNDMMLVKPVSVGHKAPDFVLTDSEGKTVKLSDYKGKYLMIDFWASWNKFSRHENPSLVKTYAKFKDKGFDILGISLNMESQNWQKALVEDQLPWRQVCEFKRFDATVVKQFKVTFLPSNFVIDGQGNIIAKNLSITELDGLLNKRLNIRLHSLR